MLQVAIKVLQKSRIKDQADARRVQREIKILKRTAHHNVIQLYEVLETPHAIYLIMEYADGCVPLNTTLSSPCNDVRVG